jgi:hypothetical protein
MYEQRKTEALVGNYGGLSNHEVLNILSVYPCTCLTYPAWTLHRFYLALCCNPCPVRLYYFSENFMNITMCILIFRRVCKIAKSDCYLRHVCPTVLLSVRLSDCPSVCPTACPSVRLSVRLSAWKYRLTQDGFSWKFTFDYFMKICRECSSFIKIGQAYRILYMKTYAYFLL